MARLFRLLLLCLIVCGWLPYCQPFRVVSATGSAVKPVVRLGRGSISGRFCRNQPYQGKGIPPVEQPKVGKVVQEKISEMG